MRNGYYFQILRKHYLINSIYAFVQIMKQEIFKKTWGKKVKYIGNLKYAQSEQKIDNINKNVKSLIRSKKVWCASILISTKKIFVG